MRINLNNILVAYDENYFEAGEVMLYSLSKNCAQSFNIHFFYNGMSETYLNKLARIIEKINSKTMKQNQLFIYDIDIEKLKCDLPIIDYWSIQVYFCLLAPEYILEEKVLYLDPDIIVQKSIDELFEINMDNVGLLMCEDNSNTLKNRRRLSIPDEYIYCNSGVMLMNLEYMRKSRFCELISDWLTMERVNKLIFPDQDIINGVAYHSIRYIDKTKYNCSSDIATDETKVIHFMGKGKYKPWIGRPPKWKIWWRYAIECEIKNCHFRYIIMNLKGVGRWLYEFYVKIFPVIRKVRILVHEKFERKQ